MFYTHFIDKRFYLKCLLNVYKITQASRFDKKRFLNIYKIDEEMKVMLEMFFKHSSWNG